MKKLILLLPVIILLSLTSTFSFAEDSYHINETEEINGRVYPSCDFPPLTGILESEMRSTRYKDGLRHGLDEAYDFATGKIIFKGNYKNGKRDGLWEYYDKNSRLAKKELYKNDKLIKTKEY